MANKTLETFTCPHCGHKHKANLWAIVDGQANTRMKKKILDGEFFDRECPECGQSYVVPYTMLYKDDVRRVMIYYADSLSCINNALRIIGERRQVVDEKSDYTIRIATSSNELREKVRIFDKGLDDRYIEIMKIALLEKINKMRNNGRTDEVRCWVKDNGELEFTFIGENSGIVTFDKSFYAYVLEKCKKAANSQYPNPAEVDLDWAIEFMDRNSFIVE